MASDIPLLEFPSQSWILTIESVLALNTLDLSNKIGVDLYIAQIILQEARKLRTGTNEQQS